jgi:hypothetical protein
MKHRLIHFFAFGSTFLVLSLSAATTRKRLETAGKIMALGCIVEVTQYVVYLHRQNFEWWDLRDDAIGIGTAFLLVQIARQINAGIALRRIGCS